MRLVNLHRIVIALVASAAAWAIPAEDRIKGAPSHGGALVSWLLAHR